MRIHSLLIAGALAGLMANATPARASDVNAPVHYTTMPTSHPHKHVRKHGGSEKHLAITKDGRTRTAGGTVSKKLIGKSKSMKHNNQSVKRSSKHHVSSRNASHKKGHVSKSTTKKYQ